MVIMTDHARAMAPTSASQRQAGRHPNHSEHTHFEQHLVILVLGTPSGKVTRNFVPISQKLLLPTLMDPLLN